MEDEDGVVGAFWQPRESVREETWTREAQPARERTDD